MTDPNGGFRFQSLSHGGYSLAPGRGVTELLDDVEVSLPVGPVGSYLPRVLGVPGTPLRRPATSTISGRLITRSGEPIADALVVLQNRRRWLDVQVTVRTDDTGRFLAENLPAGVYQIRAELPEGFRTPRVITAVAASAHRTRNLIAREKPARRRHLRRFEGRRAKWVP